MYCVTIDLIDLEMFWGCFIVPRGFPLSVLGYLAHFHECDTYCCAN